MEIKLTMSDEMEKRIQEAVDEKVGKLTVAMSGDIARLTSLVGQIEGDVTTMVKRMEEARGIVKSLNGNAEVMAAMKSVAPVTYTSVDEIFTPKEE